MRKGGPESFEPRRRMATLAAPKMRTGGNTPPTRVPTKPMRTGGPGPVTKVPSRTPRTGGNLPPIRKPVKKRKPLGVK